MLEEVLLNFLLTDFEDARVTFFVVSTLVPQCGPKLGRTSYKYFRDMLSYRGPSLNTAYAETPCAAAMPQISGQGFHGIT